MKKKKKPARGQKFGEGAEVRILRPVDDGARGVVTSASRKRNGWTYTVMFDGWYRMATRGENEA